MNLQVLSISYERCDLGHIMTPLYTSIYLSVQWKWKYYRPHKIAVSIALDNLAKSIQYLLGASQTLLVRSFPAQIVYDSIIV